METSQLIDEKYQIVRILGEGGMGAVYEARHTGTGRRVAVKVIIGEHEGNEAIVARFQREARAAGSIETQHIAHVLDTGTDRVTGHPYMVMEYLDGEDVQQCIKRIGPLDPEVAMRVISQACVGLQKAHDAGVVHRDIKPANLYLATQDDGALIVKLLDFGIAKVRSDQPYSSESASLTRTGTLLGSPLYMSPEQAMNSKSTDVRTDVWSIGIVLYETLTGVTPYAACDSFAALIMALCSQAAQPVQDLAPWVSPDLALIVRRALEIDVNRRYETVAAMHADLRALLPSGHALEKSMIKEVSDARRGKAAPRLAASTTNPGGHPQTLSSNEQQSISSAARTLVESGGGAISGIDSAPPTAPVGRPVASAGVSTGVSAGTSAGVSLSRATAPKSRTRTVAIAALVALGAAGVAGAGLYSMKYRGAPAGPDAVTNANALVSTGAPSASAAPTTTSSSAPVTRTAQLVVLPPTASVEVDGVAASVTDGAVDLHGTLGSVHKVRVFVGKKEIVGNVVISESGVSPPKIELDLKSLGSSVRIGAGASSGKPDPQAVPGGPQKPVSGATNPTPPKPDNTAVDRNFQ